MNNPGATIKYTVTAKEATTLLRHLCGKNYSPTTIRWWAHKKHITQTETNKYGAALYQLGDLINHINREALTRNPPTP